MPWALGPRTGVWGRRISSTGRDQGHAVAASWARVAATGAARSRLLSATALCGFRSSKSAAAQPIPHHWRGALEILPCLRGLATRRLQSLHPKLRNAELETCHLLRTTTTKVTLIAPNIIRAPSMGLLSISLFKTVDLR